MISKVWRIKNAARTPFPVPGRIIGLGAYASLTHLSTRCRSGSGRDFSFRIIQGCSEVSQVVNPEFHPVPTLCLYTYSPVRAVAA